MPQLYPESVQRLIAEFGQLPGIGARSAERLAFHVLASSREEAMGLAMAIRDVKQSIRACTRCFNTAEGALCPVCQSPGRDGELLCVVELPRDIVALEKCGGYQGLYHVLQGRLDPLAGIGPERLRVAELFARLKQAPVSEPLTPSTTANEPEPAASATLEETPSEDLSATDSEVAEVTAEIAEVPDFRLLEEPNAQSVRSPVREVILALNPTTEGDATANYLAQELAARFPALRITRLARGLASGTDLESSAPSSLQYALSGRLKV